MSKAGMIALVGRPNAGKSTLLNALVGTKIAIVSDKPQTTRTRIVGVRNLPEGQMVFLDTPGIHRPLHRMNVRMVDVAVQSMNHADLVCAVADAAESIGGGDKYFAGLLGKVTAPLVLALNKMDLVEKTALLPQMQRWGRLTRFADIVPVSALTGDNVDRLAQVFLKHLPDGEPLYPADFLTDQPERVYVAEIIREKLLQHTRDELPFTSAVLVDRFEEADARGIIRVYCSIVVERESQKPIVIGRAGSMIKQIGTEARLELESFFATKVFLDLRVKTRAGWREDSRVLDQLGVIDDQ
ncbi:MAG: GTPase Era [Acidobacteria bacterium]|nr:GTPase Era [Acidobacteriota bacterium]